MALPNANIAAVTVSVIAVTIMVVNNEVLKVTQLVFTYIKFVIFCISNKFLFMYSFLFIF